MRNDDGVFVMAEPRANLARTAMENMFATAATASKLKRAMQRRGLLRAKAKCPRCGGAETLQGKLVPHGRSQHLRMWCTTAGCNTQVWE